MHGMPIIRMEIQGMRETLVAALSEHRALIDRDVQSAVEHFCESDQITLMVSQTVQDTLKKVLAETIQYHFQYGQGREDIDRAVQFSLRKMGRKRKPKR